MSSDMVSDWLKAASRYPLLTADQEIDLAHKVQLGSFLGVWLGGKMYDIYSTYTVVWWFGVGVGLFSAIVHLPIKERSLPLKSAKQATSAL